MRVSCICPTYNRVPLSKHLLEEAVASFIAQDYPDKELIILNDNAAQTLTCDVPGVRIINERSRYKSLGEKYNAMVSTSSGDLIAPWEDDDISLPWRLSLSVRTIALTGAEYYNPRRYWFYSDGQYHHKHPQGVGHACSMYTKSAHEKVKGYCQISGNQDDAIDRALTKSVRTRGSLANGDSELHISKWFYIYRWDTGSSHLSAHNVYAEAHDCQGGTFKLEPHWRADYVEIVRNQLCSRR